MFDAIRNWFEVRAAVKDARRIRAGQATLNSIIVSDKLKHANEMIHAGQTAYATAIIDEMLERYPSETADLPAAIGMLIDLQRLDDAEALTMRGMRANPDSREFAHLHCEIADRRGEIGERLRRWRAFRRRYPALAMAFIREARTLVAADQDAAAEEVLREGVRTVPDDAGLAIEYAQRADARQDWPEAYRRWLVVRDAHGIAIGAVASAAALARQGLDDQAEAELLAARARFPLEPRIVEDLAALAERRGNLDGAVAYWAELRRDLPHITRGYIEGARLLRQRGDQPAADAVIAEGAARAPDDRGLQFDHAGVAERDGDWAEAARRWQRARQRFATDPMPYRREATALRALGQLDEAEEVLLAAHARFPDAADIQQHLAELAEARGDLTLAADRWRAVVAAVPDVWWMRSALARVLARGGDRAGADDALAAAIARLPDEPSLYAEHAALAAQDGRADAAAARWAAARQRFGLHPTIARGEANWLRGQGRLTEARAILGAASQQAPDNADVLHDLGHLAAQERDWAEAERCWRALLALQPQAGGAYGELARVLREQGRAAEAEGMLAEAWERHPWDFGIGAAWARAASEAKDWPEARRRWALLGERFPAEGHPVWQEGIALREAGRTDEARALFLAGAERFPGDPSFAHDLARLAEARQDHAEAEQYWLRYLSLMPNAWWGWLGVATAVHAQGHIDAAEALLLRGDAACPDTPLFLAVHAQWARDRRDWAEAERRAGVLAARFPDAWEGLWGTAVAARQQGRPDEAQTLLLRGADLHPAVATFPHDLARLAEGRDDWTTAARWWQVYLRLEPASGWAWTWLAKLLSQHGQIAEAEAVLLEADTVFPADPSYCLFHARLAERGGDWPEAEHRYAQIQVRFADLPDAIRGQARALRQQGRHDAAAEVLRAAVERHPEVAAFAHDLAQAAEGARDWQGAAHWWGELIAADDTAAAWIHGARAHCLQMLGRHDTADAELLAAIARQPDAVELHHEYARAADRLGRRAQSMQRWARAAERFADDPVSVSMLGLCIAGTGAHAAAARLLEDAARRLPGHWTVERAQLQVAALREQPAPDRIPPRLAPPPIRLAVSPGTEDADAIAEVERITRMKIRDFIMQFDTLGESCEFGFIQRYCGAEPLSLMRFAGMVCTDMARAIRSEFAGLGKRLVTEGTDDWDVRDLTFQMAYHTFRPRTEPEAVLLASEPRRLRFLARKLLGDIDEAGKIFVVWRPFIGLTPAVVQPLIDAVHARNPAATVVFITPGAAVGGAERLGPHLYRGHVRALAHYTHQAGASVHAWLEMLVNVWLQMRDTLPSEDRVTLEADETDDAVLQAACAALPERLDLAYAWAERATQAADWTEAQRRWAWVTARFPDEPEPASHQATAARQAGDAAAARALLLAAAERQPGHANFALELARLAEAEADWPAAEHWWGRFVGLAPDTWWGQLALARAIRAQDRPAAADDVLARAIEALPSEPGLLQAHAEWAREQGDWPEAERRARLLMERVPDAWQGPWGLAVTARDQGRLDEAEQLLREGFERHPGSAPFPSDLAQLAQARGDWAAAEQWWRALLAIDPGIWWAHTALANALHRQGRRSDAEAVLLAAHAALPGEPGILIDYARLAEHADGRPAAAETPDLDAPAAADIA